MRRAGETPAVQKSEPAATTPAAATPPARLKDDRHSLPIALLRAREAVMGLFRPHHRRGGISEPQWRVIRVLHLEGETDATTLARFACLLPPSLSRILKDLEAAGLVRRRPGHGDSRQSLLSLSPKAAAMVARVAPFLDGIHRDIARRFGRDRLDALLALLAELETALADSSPLPSSAGEVPRHTGLRRAAAASAAQAGRRGNDS